MSPLNITITVETNKTTSTTKFNAETFISRAKIVSAVRTTQSQLSARWTRLTAAKATESHSCSPIPVNVGW